MKKLSSLLALGGFLFAFPAFAAVTVGSGPTSLVTSPVTVMASSGQVALFSITLSQDAGETLSSVAVTINNNGTSAASGADLASVSVYKDSNANGIFDSGVDLAAGTQTTVNIGSPTVVATSSNNAIGGGKFFVSLATAASWSGAAPADSVTVTFPASGIITSANSPTVVAATTAAITADAAAPTLVSAVAKNTGGTSNKEVGDSIALTFSEATNKPSVTSANIASILTLNNSHSFLDGAGALGGAAWNVSGKVLTVTLSSGTSLPTVAVGDTVTVAGGVILDLAGNAASGAKTISGSFARINDDDDDDDDEDGDRSGRRHACAVTIINGQLYRIGNDPTVYLAAACRLKPFRGAAVFFARGHKFHNITALSGLPTNVTISDQPVLPAEGTLIKGSNATVWFVDSHGKRRGFTQARVFLVLGFSFAQVQTISDSDLNVIPPDLNIDDENRHPDGALIKCNNSASVFEVIDGFRFPFASAQAFRDRGHAFDHILQIDCNRFRYTQGAEVD